ncbi:MAG: PASTA domain-containing protein [Gammaproteobacteria bacterium]|nr:PASTA domain-containing protein [Gammaproteobacteria bacterium]
MYSRIALILLTLIFICSCNSDSDSSRPIDSENNISIAMPKARNLAELPQEGSWRAFLYVFGNTTNLNCATSSDDPGACELSVNTAAEKASGRIDLDVGTHDVLLNWFYRDPIFINPSDVTSISDLRGYWFIAGAEKSVTIVAGQTASLTFNQNDYPPLPDDDSDGISNLAELEQRTDPWDFDDPTVDIAVPNVLGLTLEGPGGARSQIENMGLVVGSVAEEFSETVGKDKVISQVPSDGVLVRRGSAVSLVVSFGPLMESTCPTQMTQYFKLDENSAPYTDLLNVVDAPANCTNCPTAITGRVGGGQRFDGSDDEVDVPDRGQFDWGVEDEFSIEYWMRSNSNCSGNEVIIGRQGTSHPEPHMWTGCHGKFQHARFVLFDAAGGNGGNGIWPESSADITDGNWHHIVAVRDATHIHLYVDGAKSSVAKNYTAGFASTTPLNIGYLNAFNHYRYEGDLDEVAYYSRALTDVEVQKHYDNGLTSQGYCQTEE